MSLNIQEHSKKYNPKPNQEELKKLNKQKEDEKREIFVDEDASKLDKPPAPLEQDNRNVMPSLRGKSNPLMNYKSIKNYHKRDKVEIVLALKMKENYEILKDGLI